MRTGHRRLILGIDEAGYGPNIGPLVIGCSAWIVDDLSSTIDSSRPAAETMLERLASSFQSKPIRSIVSHIPLGDSKALYASGDSLETLSLGVRYWLDQIDRDVMSVDGALSSIAPACSDTLANFPWYQSRRCESSITERFRRLDESIPASLHASASKTYRDAGLRFLGVTAMIVDEQRFNREVETLGNKARLLSEASLQLASDCLNTYTATGDPPLDAMHVYCDKHGGRNRYQALLMHVFPELWFDLVHESAARSDYSARWRDCAMRWSFVAKGDSLFASALASMTAKWIRELLMARINAFWRSHLPDLKPTAGYPGDAGRFRSAIEPMADRLAYPVSDWWRFR